MKEKEAENANITRRIEALNSNLEGLQNTVKNEIDKTYNTQVDNHKEVSQQLTRLFNQFDALQQKLYVDKK